MYVISIKDVNNILKRYELAYYGRVVSIEVLQYYQSKDKIGMVLLVETVFQARYVIKMWSNKPTYKEERQAEFSEFLRVKGLPIPQKYKTRNKYIGCFNFIDTNFSVVVEDYWGDNIKMISTGSIIALGRLLADMHKMSMTYKYHLEKGSTYCALFSGRVGIDVIWRENKHILFETDSYNKIKSAHEMAISKIKKMWMELPIYAVHGDLGLLTNITIHENKCGIIDFNLSGDEVLLNDMLITWYSSVYAFDIALFLSLKERINYRKYFFNSYIRNRNLTSNEQKYLYDMACIINGVYFNRFAALLASKGLKKTAKKMIPHIYTNYYCLDSDMDIQSELQKEIY